MSAKRKRHLAAKRGARTRKLRARRHRGLPHGKHHGIMGGVYDKKSWAHVTWGKHKRKRKRTEKQKRATKKLVAYNKKNPVRYCKSCRRPIFGGKPGFRSHEVLHHGGRTVAWSRTSFGGR